MTPNQIKMLYLTCFYAITNPRQYGSSATNADLLKECENVAYALGVQLSEEDKKAIIAYSSLTK